MIRLQSNLDLASRILICAAVLFSIISALTFWNRLVIWKNKSGYEPASFVVIGAHFQGFADGTIEFWLDGAIAGREERLIPRFTSKKRPLVRFSHREQMA